MKQLLRPSTAQEHRPPCRRLTLDEEHCRPRRESWAMTKAQQAAVSNYLTSLRDPSALRDDDAIADLHSKLDQTDHDVERLKLSWRPSLWAGTAGLRVGGRLGSRGCGPGPATGRDPDAHVGSFASSARTTSTLVNGPWSPWTSSKVHRPSRRQE
jgi:hypothetical protein